MFPDTYAQLANQKKNFTALIMCILKLPTNVLPFLYQPLFLTDFLTDCYNYGGVLAVMALGGLFYLITNYHVNYPEYYPKLYELLTADIFTLK